MQEAQTTEIVDLCSGGTGPWLNLQPQLTQSGYPVSIKLTDKYPHPEAVQRWANVSDGSIECLTEPVDALEVPPHLKGMRTLFEGFHHFRPKQAQAILRNVVGKRRAIGIFEASLKMPFGLLTLPVMPLMTVMSYFLMTPFIRPLTLARFFWTYLVPEVPLATSWDGIVSLLRVYSPPELEALIEPLGDDDYDWEIGVASMGVPVFVYTYLVGYPNRDPDGDPPGPDDLPSFH
jgi:hypothetical protein